MRSEDGGCYFWSYEEDWEVRAVYNPKFRYDPTTDEVVDFDATPYARGWCHDKSAKIIVGNIGTNKDTQLKDKWLYSIKADNNRVFHHYSTLVKQRKISRGEYEYYQEKIKSMKKWVDCLFLSLQNFLRILFATIQAKM